MVVVNEKIIEREMRAREWDATQLAARMGVHFNTARNMLNGEGVGHNTQVALFNAFDGKLPFTKLFMVTAGTDEATIPQEAATA